MRFSEITVVFLTRDEEAMIGAALAALPREAPCIIYDAESRDATAAIARSHGATVVSAPWTNFRDARAAALGCSTTAWTFMLDADERPDAELLAAVAALENPECAGYRFFRRNFFCGRPVTGGAWAGEYVMRLVRTDAASVSGKDGGTVHEQLVVTGPVGTLPGRIDHYSYSSLAEYRRKFMRYTTIEARDAIGAGRAINGISLVRALPAALLQYFGRGGWRDGWRGAFIAAASAAYPFVVAWKIARGAR